MDEVQPKKKRRGGPTMMCGWVFQYSWYHGTSGYTRESQPGMSGNCNHHFHDQVSSVKVENGCELHLFRDHVVSSKFLAKTTITSPFDIRF